MKYLLLALIMVILVMIGYFFFQEGKIIMNNERIGIILLRGGYRAWWIRYSDGLEYPYHRFKDNLWCWPRFEHCDVRRLIGSAQ